MKNVVNGRKTEIIKVIFSHLLDEILVSLQNKESTSAATTRSKN
jgi:hypothetical protein